MYGLVEMTNAEIVAAGGVFLREETYASDRDWTFTNF